MALALVVCLVVVEACGFGSPSVRDGDGAGHQTPSIPTYDLGAADSPVAGWQMRTADTVARLLTQQEKGVVIAEAPAEPRVAEALRAAATLRLLGWRTRVSLGIDRRDGLVREGSQDPLSLTRLQVIATGETTATMRSAVRAQLRGLRPRLLRHQPSAVLATRSGLDVLELGRDLRKTDLPADGLCPAAGEKRIEVAAALLTIAQQTGLACVGSADWVERAVETVSDTSPTTPRGHEQILSAGRLIAESGGRLQVPGGCLDLLGQRSAYRELIPSIAYQTCAEVVGLAGANVDVNHRVASDLELLAETGGRVYDALQIDVVGLHYSVLVLRLLGFGQEHLDAVRKTEAITNGTALDKVRLALANGAELPLPGRGPVTSPDDSYAAALTVNAGGRCPDTWRPQAAWRTTKSGAVDSFELLRHASIVAAQATCSGRPVPAAERRRILAAAEALHRTAWRSARSAASVTDLWKASESRCLMGAEPDLPDAVSSRLPDYATLSETELDLGELLAAVRLSDIARHGCGSEPWPLSGD